MRVGRNSLNRSLWGLKNHENGGALDMILDMVTADVMYVVDWPHLQGGLAALCLVLGLIVYRALEYLPNSQAPKCKYGFTGNKRICRRCEGKQR
jgi:hypothetical protein